MVIQTACRVCTSSPTAEYGVFSWLREVVGASKEYLSMEGRFKGD